MPTQSAINPSPHSWLLSERRWLKKRSAFVTIDASHSDFKEGFPECYLRTAYLLSYFFGYHNFAFHGDKTEYSELLLSSPNAKKLLSCRNAKLGLDAKGIYFSGVVRINDNFNKYGCIYYMEKLIEEMDDLIKQETKSAHIKK